MYSRNNGWKSSAFDGGKKDPFLKYRIAAFHFFSLVYLLELNRMKTNVQRDARTLAGMLYHYVKEQHYEDLSRPRRDRR